MRLPIVLLLASTLAGCATITRGTTENVTLNSEPAGATARTSVGLVCDATPCTFEMARKQDFAVVFTKPGYREETVVVATQTPFGGGAALAGNLLAGGLVGIALDSSNGATLEHTPNPVFVALKPEEPEQKPLAVRKPRQRVAGATAVPKTNESPKPTPEQSAAATTSADH